MPLPHTDPRTDPDAWARRLGISRRAVDIFAAAHSIDLHIESFIWTRVFGYDLAERHRHGAFGARFYSQVDLPRALDSGMTGGVWSIATNPFRRRRNRTAVLLKNLARLRATIKAHDDQLCEVWDHAGYVRARAQGKYAIWLAIQGGNALDSAADDVEKIPDNCVSRITVVHMTRSTLGSGSMPLTGGGGGLTALGKDFVARMNGRRILVDLSHIAPKGFWQALDTHDPTLPPMVSHTGVNGANPSWRNLDDRQVRAIADRGGVVGIVFHSMYLDGSLLGGKAEAIVDHIEHVINVAGEDTPALGSDWDGLIVTPRDMKTILEIPRLVQLMLDRGWSEARIQKVLGANYLNMLKMIRPGV